MNTAKDVIKILPFSETFKNELLAKYDLMDEDQQVTVLRAVWDLYDALYEVTLDENLKSAFERAKQDEEKLDQDFYMRVRKQTYQEFQKTIRESETVSELSSTRDELQKILDKTT